MVIAVATLAGIGAVARVAVAGRLGGGARGILLVNVLGSLVLGVLTGLGAGDDVLLYAGTAVLGSFTTFSTWMLDEERLVSAGDVEGAVRLLLGATVIGGLAAAVGWWIGSLHP